MITKEEEQELKDWLNSITYVEDDGTPSDMDDFGEDEDEDPEGDRGEEEEPPVTPFVPRGDIKEE